MTDAVLLELVERFRDELGDLDRVEHRIQRAWQGALRFSTESDIYLDSVALNLQGFYTGVERLLLLTARHVDLNVPEGEAWHRQLLAQAAREIPGVRPAIISPISLEALDEFRRFRHLVRNVYSENLIPGKIKNLMDLISRTWPQIRSELAAFADYLAQVVDSSSDDGKIYQ